MSVILNMIENSSLEFVKGMVQTLFDKKGFNIISLDVRGVSTATDYFIIAEGNVDRHVKALADAIIQDQKEKNHYPLHIEGDRVGDWMVIDFGDIIVHLFTPGLRDKYAIERLWSDGKIIDTEINTEGDV